MKRISILMLVLSCVLYLSTATFAQGRGGLAPSHGLDHDRDVNHDKNQGKADAREDSKEGNFLSRIQRNPELSEKLQSLLPKTGPNNTLAAAAMGFKSEGQFIAALHVSNNLPISFDTLKMKMMGPPSMSLGQAIHALKPDLSGKDLDKEVDKAEKEAKVDERAKPVTKPVT